jgi:serine/threonine-protein kinase RIO1
MVNKTWQDKAEELRERGYMLNIYAMAELDGNKWVASIEGEGRRYSLTIENAIEQVYEWVAKEWR